MDPKLTNNANIYRNLDVGYANSIVTDAAQII